MVTQRPLLLPRPGTFYSVDALNPDVVRRGRTYYMFFSGNREHSPAGLWRTGVATSRSPLGPFRVHPGLRGAFLNGGTTLWRGQFWQATTHYKYGTVLMSSRNGLRWRRVAPIPAPPGWPVMADFYLRPRGSALRAYMLVRTNPTTSSGGNIASMDWIDGKWTRFKALLPPGPLPWENLDLGEPAVFSVPGRELMLYTATAAPEGTRTIGLARRAASGSWVRCAKRPFIGTGAPWGEAISIDPSVLVEGNRVYVYYGAGSGKSLASDLGGAIGLNVYRVKNGD